IKLNKEPIVLPTVIPNLLIIAVGIKKNAYMPPHNIVESINAYIGIIYEGVKLTYGNSEVIIAVWKNNNNESTSAEKGLGLKEEKVIGMICINDFKKEYILVVYDLSPYSKPDRIKRIKIN
ncbi:MAG: hypothetical protein ACFS26_01190, partial [Candidatus Karelsulcia muelleri]